MQSTEVRPRDLIGYGGRPPKVVWPNGAKVAINLVINYEEGSEAYERLGDSHTDGLAELIPFPRIAETLVETPLRLTDGESGDGDASIIELR